MNRPEKLWEMISMDIDNQLNKKELEELHEMLLQDPGLQKEYDGIKQMVDSLHQMPLVDVPEGFHDDLLQKLNAEGPVKGKITVFSKLRVKPVQFVGLAASFVLCLVMVSSLFFPSDSVNYDGAAPQESFSLERSSSFYSTKDEDDAGRMAYSDSMPMPEEAGIDSGEFFSSGAASDYEALDVKEFTTNQLAAGEVNTQKLIKSKDITIQIKDFENFSQEVKAITDTAGGYVESANSYVHQFDYGSSISGYFRLKVPVEAYEAVTGEIQALGTVLGESEYVDDITQQYYDMQGRLEIKLTERDKLLELLEKSDSIQDIIALEERLAQVTYEIESFETDLRDWDRQVAYSTIHIYAEDGLDVQIVPVQRDFGAKFYNNLTTSVNNLRIGTENIILWGAAHSIQILLIGVLGVAAWFLGRKILRQRKR